MLIDNKFARKIKMNKRFLCFFFCHLTDYKKKFNKT